LIPDDLLGPLADVWDLQRHDDPKRRRGQGAEKRGVPDETAVSSDSTFLESIECRAAGTRTKRSADVTRRM
jgi:hypothetical protein